MARFFILHCTGDKVLYSGHSHFGHCLEGNILETGDNVSDNGCVITYCLEGNTYIRYSLTTGL